ncbi:MAG: hypothetical protein WC346_00045 [Methanogenium sp.]|jgi:hypothetical protein
MSDKTWEAFANEMVIVMVEGIGLIMGKFSKNNYGVPCLKRPRAVQVRTSNDPKAEKKAEVRLGEMMGTPDELFLINKPIILYPVKDRNLLDLYARSTTGLTITSNMPTGAK